MGSLLWGKVYYKDIFAGIIREEPGERISFAYDQSYLAAHSPAIAHTLPLRPEPYISDNGLPPFFDNLVSEGWLERAQGCLLGKRNISRFALLLAFGFDCAGAVSIVDPEPSLLSEAMLDVDDPKEMAVFTSRASLSGVQPKLAIIKKGSRYRPASINELSSHIAKFPSAGHPNLVENEYVSTLAFKALLPDDETVDLEIANIEGLQEPALLIKRFDRHDGERIHFEEFNQLLGNPSRAKYDGSHKEMADFIHANNDCIPIQAFLLYRRILTGLLLSNTDMHLKNFAMIYSSSGLKLAPNYDQVGAAMYDYKTLALTMAGSKDHRITGLRARHLVLLGEEFKLPKSAIKMAVDQLAKNKEVAKETILDASRDLTGISKAFPDKLITLMEKRWNGTFDLIGKVLSARQ